jgi:glyoxylate reductase
MIGTAFVTRRIPEAGLAALRGNGAIVRIGQPHEDHPLSRQVLIDGVRNADVLLPLLTERIDSEVLAANPRLLGVANFAVGYDNIDIAAASRLGLPVSNTPDVLTEATADFTWALMLAVARRIVEGDRYMRAGSYRIWGPSLLLGQDVGPGPDGHARTLGLIGFGRIGRAVARRARGFDMRVIAHDPGAQDAGDVELVPLPELLRRSDFVSIHASLTTATHHLIAAPELRCMKPTAFLINAARGPIVDEAALVQALREEWIAGAALDVYEHEPAMAPGLADLPNVVLAPHTASATVDTRDRMAAIAAANAIAHLRGERAPHCVNPDVYQSAAWRARQAGSGPLRGASSPG